jgi:hypothetical protein
MTVPSNRWFPTTLQDRAAWYDNFNTQIQIVGLTVGLVAGDLANITKDNDNIQFLATAAVTLDAYVEAVRQYRVIFTEGDVGDPMPAFPADVTFTLPLALPTGAFERLNDWVKRIRVAPAYTNEIGALLDIIPSTPGETPEAEVQPDLKISTETGYVVKAVGAMQGMDAIRFEYQRNGTTTWNIAAFLTNLPNEFTITPATPGQPESGRIRAIFIKKSEDFGSFSPDYPVTVS